MNPLPRTERWLSGELSVPGVQEAHGFPRNPRWFFSHLKFGEGGRGWETREEWEKGGQTWTEDYWHLHGEGEVDGLSSLCWQEKLGHVAPKKGLRSHLCSSQPSQHASQYVNVWPAQTQKPLPEIFVGFLRTPRRQ